MQSSTASRSTHHSVTVRVYRRSALLFLRVDVMMKARLPLPSPRRLGFPITAAFQMGENASKRLQVATLDSRRPPGVGGDHIFLIPRCRYVTVDGRVQSGACKW
jgi:hypothetical protein